MPGTGKSICTGTQDGIVRELTVEEKSSTELKPTSKFKVSYIGKS